MKHLTTRDLDEELERGLRQTAQRDGMSLNAAAMGSMLRSAGLVALVIAALALTGCASRGSGGVGQPPGGPSAYPPPPKSAYPYPIAAATPYPAPSSILLTERPQEPTTTAESLASLVAYGTSTSEPTETPSPTYALTPVAVMRLHDAKAQVMGWLDRRRAPRIEHAYYVQEGDLSELRPDWGPYNWFAPFESGLDAPDPIPSSPRLLAVIEASTQGLDLLHQAGQHAGQRPSSSNADVTWPDWCSPVPSTRRQSVVAMFDATTGELVGAGPVTAQLRPALDDLARLGRRALPGATPLALPKATATPIARDSTMGTMPSLPCDAGELRPLAIGEVPPGLIDAVRQYPLINGARWVYSVTGESDGVHWWRRVYTETVSAAWALGADAMLVEVTVPSGADGPGQSPFTFVFPEGVVDDLNGHSIAQARAALRQTAPPTTQAHEWPKTPIRGAIRLPLREPERVDYWREMERVDRIAVPAGAYPACYLVRDVFNAGNSDAGWLCPGVGYARRDIPMCSSMYGSYEVDELVRYYIPPIRPGTGRAPDRGRRQPSAIPDGGDQGPPPPSPTCGPIDG
jgi:hypothetical protein